MRAPTALSAAVIGGSIAACSPGPAAGPEEETGAGSQAQATYCLINAHTDVGTVHFQGPDWLLSSSQARAPLEIDLRIESYVQPAVSTTTDIKLDPDTISKAVGYRMAERYRVMGGARFTPSMTIGSERLEAYTAYQRTVWEIRDASCAVPLGMGASFKPIGVYFRVTFAASIALPEIGVVVPGGAVPEGP